MDSPEGGQSGLCPLLEGYFVQIAVLWGHAGCPLSGVERYPLLRGSKCTISIGRAIGGMEFVCCTEVVRLSESVIRGFTVEPSLYTWISYFDF